MNYYRCSENRNNMRISYSIIIFVCGLISCSKKEVDFNLCNSSYDTKNITCFVIENNSTTGYAFYNSNFSADSNRHNIIDCKIQIVDENGASPKSNNIYIDNLFPSEIDIKRFLGEEKKDSVLWNSLLTQGIRVDYQWVKQYRSLKENKILLLPKGQHKFSLNIPLLRKQLQRSGTYYSFEKNKKYFIEIELTFDSVKIKNSLLAADIDSLKKNKIKIFHGNIKTKKVAIDF